MRREVPLHPILARQLRRLTVDPGRVPDPESWQGLLERVSAAYADADDDRYTLERAIEISSQEMQQLHDELAEREQFRTAIVEGAAEGFVTVGADGRILSFNAAASAIFGWDQDEIVGQPLEAIVPPSLRQRHRAGFARYLHTGQPTILGRTVEVEGLRRNGQTFPMQIAISEVRIGDRVSFAGILRDVSDYKALEAALHRQATHDTLTGLPNRARLLVELDAELCRARERDARVGVLFVDLDRFKVVNDSLGHQAGDALLVQAAERIAAVVREHDLVARIGGDEFVVVCRAATDDSAVLHVAERIRAELERSFLVGDDEAFVSASIGVAIAGADADAEGLLRSADLAMYRAKKAGKNRYTIFDDAMRAWADTRLSLENALRRALAGGELELHYQPQFALADLSIVGAEALVRWRRPGAGLVLPGAFLHLAEETGLIVDIGGLVIDKAVEEAAAWRRTWPERGLTVAVNLSARELQRPDTIRRVEQALARHGLPAHLLAIELTEATLLVDSEHSKRVLDGLRRLGTRIVIDDFGTGFSSLSYLRRVPADGLKIDRSFVEDIDADGPAAEIVGAILAMGQAVGLEVVVEGVERPTQLEVLRDLGAASGQGFHLGRPVAATELRAQLGSARLGAVA